MKHILRASLAILLCLATATTASAALFTVTLSNGTIFETRYRPVEADWDDSVVMILTDQGNWIALAKADVADVVSEAEATGFGYQLNTTTLFVGWTPNDLVDDDAEGEDGEGGGSGGGNSSPANAQDGGEYEEDGGSFSLEQFVDIPVAGDNIGGISLDASIPGGGG